MSSSATTTASTRVNGLPGDESTWIYTKERARSESPPSGLSSRRGWPRRKRVYVCAAGHNEASAHGTTR